MKNKIISLILVCAASVFLVTGCGAASTAGTEQEQETAAEEEAPEEEGPLLPADMKIGICVAPDSEDYETAFYSRLDGYLIKAGFTEANIMRQESEWGGEAACAKALLDAGCDVLVADAGEPENVAPIRQLAMQSDVPVIFVITEPPAEELEKWKNSDWNAVYIGGDSSLIGELRESILDGLDYETLDASGDHVLGCLVLNVPDQSAEGVMANKTTLEALDRDHYKNEVLTTAVFREYSEESDEGVQEWNLSSDVRLCEYEDRDEMASEIGDLLDEFGESVEVILCADDELACAAADAMQEHRKSVEHDVQILGCEATQESLERTAAEEILGTIFNDYLAQAKKTSETLLAFCKQEKVEVITYCDYVKVTVDNAREIIDITASGDEEDSDGSEEDPDGGEESSDEEDAV